MGNEIKLTVDILSGNNEERLFMLALVVDVYIYCHKGSYFHIILYWPKDFHAAWTVDSPRLSTSRPSTVVIWRKTETKCSRKYVYLSVAVIAWLHGKLDRYQRFCGLVCTVQLVRLLLACLYGV